MSRLYPLNSLSTMICSKSKDNFMDIQHKSFTYETVHFPNTIHVLKSKEWNVMYPFSTKSCLLQILPHFLYYMVARLANMWGWNSFLSFFFFFVSEWLLSIDIHNWKWALLFNHNPYYVQPLNQPTIIIPNPYTNTRQVDSNPLGVVWMPFTLWTVWL
jgi:hypothetical protein